MDKHRNNSTTVGNRYVALRMVGVMLAAIVAVALMSGGAFAHSGEEAEAGRSIRADANPSMNVALWYVPPTDQRCIGSEPGVEPRCKPEHGRGRVVRARDQG